MLLAGRQIDEAVDGFERDVGHHVSTGVGEALEAIDGAATFGRPDPDDLRPLS
jgi:hypothetical protein